MLLRQFTFRLREQLAKAHCQISALTQQALNYPVASISPTYNGSQPVQQSAWSHQGQPKVYESQTRRYDRRPDVRPNSDNSGSQLPYRVLCFSCGEPGHYKRNCPRLNPTTSGGSYQQRSQGQKDNAMFNSRVAGTSTGRSPVYLKVKVRHRPRLCVLDSGCDTTLIPLRFVGNHHVYKTEQKCQAANGSQIPIVGSTTIPGQVGRKHVNISGLVSDHVMDLMLGIDWLQENDITWNFNKGEIHLAGETFKLRARESRHPYLSRPSRSACHATYVTCAATTTESTEQEQQQPASEELETEQRLTPRDGGPRDYPIIDEERVIAAQQENSPEDSQITYDDFVDNRLQFNVDAFQLAREHLGVNAERRKLDYDQHVKSKEFKTGDWIWYYYPRRYQKRSPKWSKDLRRTIPRHQKDFTVRLRHSEEQESNAYCRTQQ